MPEWRQLIATQECGCEEFQYDGWRGITACRLHSVAWTAFYALHTGMDDAHAECCDLPMVREAVDKFGRDDVRGSVALLKDEDERAYAARLVAMLDA